MRSPVGLEAAAAFEAPVDGSISNEDKKDVLASSDFVLVIVKNESSNAFCSDLGVPLRSSICYKQTLETRLLTRKGNLNLLEV